MANEINTLNIGGSVYPIVPKEVELNSSLAAGNVVFTGINVATGKNSLNSTDDLSYLLEKGVGTLVTPSIKTDIIKQSGSEYHITDSNGNILASFSSGGLSTTGVSVNSVPVSIEGHKHGKEDITNFAHSHPGLMQQNGSINTAHIDLTTYTANATGFEDKDSGVYNVARSGHSDTYIKFKGTGSASGLEFLSSYSNDARLKFRKIIDANRISGDWKELAFLSDVKTYTFENGKNCFYVTPSGGSKQTVNVTPSIANNITGSGTSGYIAKFNGTNTITNGPAFGSATTTYLRNDGNWATPSDTKVNVTLETTSKAYLLATKSTPTSTATGRTAISDTGVYLTTEAGGLQATKMYASSGFFESTYSSSDERLKNFSDDIEIDFDKLLNIKKKYFTWKDDDGKQHIGTSAQDIQEIYPELVTENIETGYLSVDYAKLSIIALAAIDKLANKQKDLEERLERLEKMIK